MTVRQQIIATLSKLVVRRQAEVESAVFDVYTDDIIAARVELEDLTAVCDSFGLLPRTDYQTAFPSIADILHACSNRHMNRRDTALLHAHAEKRALGPPMSPERAEVWLNRVRHTAHHGGTLDEAERLFPMPEETGHADLS